MKYLKLFANHSAYNSAKDGLALPNVSHCVQENDVHYAPVTPPQPIAPVGKVQVFANPQCTAYADGQSDTVWVRVNQDFGYNQEETWSPGPENQWLKVATPSDAQSTHTIT